MSPPDPEAQTYLLDLITVNPLGGFFMCAACGEPCLSTSDERGVWRNPDEAEAVLFRGVNGGDAIERTDFCGPDCLEIFQWRLTQKAS